MNVASCDCRFFLIISLFLCLGNSTYSMVLDNRYFPWIPHLYTSSDHSHAHVTTEAFFVTGGDAYRHEDRAEKDKQTISYPELWGELKLADVKNSMVKVGLKDPIPADWQWLSDFRAKMNGSLEGQGVMVGGYVPVTKHIGFGASGLLLRLNALVNVVPHEETVSKLFLNTPGNQALFTQTLSNIYKELDITCTSLKEVGVGDVVVYFNIYDVHEYRYKMRKIDWGFKGGVIIPSGLKMDPHNLASIPFGGNGLWGWFIAPYTELELKEDLKFGIQARVTQRIDKSILSRVPVGKEQPLFAPIVGDVCVDAGTSFTGSAYFAFEDLRAGFGIQAKYTVTYHEHDTFSAHLENTQVKPNFSCMNWRSEWVSEYATIRLFYDVGHDKTWKHRPLVSFTWDIPRNHIGGKGFAKTHRVSLGCTVNF